MPIGLIFWVLFLFWIISRFFYYGPYVRSGPWPFWGIGGDFLTMVLIFLLGWHEFGFIVRYS